jgi:hypothetical protein
MEMEAGRKVVSARSRCRLEPGPRGAETIRKLIAAFDTEELTNAIERPEGAGGEVAIS